MDKYRMRWYHWLLWPGFCFLGWIIEYIWCPIPHPDQSWVSVRVHAWRRIKRKAKVKKLLENSR